VRPVAKTLLVRIVQFRVLAVEASQIL
jgi:hypothetical protein